MRETTDDDSAEPPREARQLLQRSGAEAAAYSQPRLAMLLQQAAATANASIIT